jgi:hypothetical protein
MRAPWLRPTWILVGAWLLAVLYAFPGYMNWDSGEQLYQARTGIYEDWHAPMMAWLWRIVEHVVSGPFGMLVLQLTAFLGGMYLALRQRFAPRTAAIVASALLLFPPVLTPMAVVWKDAQLAGWLIAGTMLAVREQRWQRIAGIAMLVLAAGVRDNGMAALPPLCVLIAATWGFPRKLLTVGVAAALTIGISSAALIANHALTDIHAHAWYRANAIHDVVGAICHEDQMTDAEVREALAGIPISVDSNLQSNICLHYDPQWWLPLTVLDGAIFATVPGPDDRRARKHAWYGVVRHHTLAWLRHRWAVTSLLLGLSADPPDEPVCQSTVDDPFHQVVNHDGARWGFQTAIGDAFRWLGTTVLYRPWLYALLALLLAADAVRRRDRWVIAVTCSGLLYEASYLLGAAGGAYRYSHWMVTGACLSLAIVVGERVRARFASRS